MSLRKVAKAEYMKSLWGQALLQEIVFDYTGETHSEGRITALRIALYNYRRRIRRYKLRPEYSQEWSNLQKCEVSRQTNSRLVIRKIPELLFGRKAIILSPNLPFRLPTTKLCLTNHHHLLAPKQNP